MQLTPTSGNSTPMDLIPRGFLCWTLVSYRGMKASQSGGQYADLELVVADRQPYSKRKIWTKIGDPDHGGNSEGYRNMGMTALTRMVESAGIVDPKDPASYEKLNGLTCHQVCSMLDGKYVAIKIKIEKGEGGYEDKNDVGDYLTPNPQSSGNKGFLKLLAGDHGVTASPTATGTARPASGFGSSGSSAPVHAGAGNGGGFGSQGGAQHGGQERPFVPAQTMTRSPSEGAPASPAPAATGGGFNPNQAPSFLKAHNP